VDHFQYFKYFKFAGVFFRIELIILNLLEIRRPPPSNHGGHDIRPINAILDAHRLTRCKVAAHNKTFRFLEEYFEINERKSLSKFKGWDYTLQVYNAAYDADSFHICIGKWLNLTIRTVEKHYHCYCY
jgi:hypothetical protein